MSSSLSAPESDVAILIRAQQSVQAEPDSVEAHFEHALALCRVSRWEEATGAWRNVVRLEPGNAFAYINMGVVHLEQAQWAQAEQAFRQALNLQPHQPAAHYGLGAACAQQGELEAARVAWEQALHLSPDHAEARAALDELNLLAEEDALPPVECVITSQINLQPPSSTQMPVAALSIVADAPAFVNAPSEMLHEEKPVAVATQSHRIKLPQFNGPNLTAIADTVMAAQHAPRPDGAVYNAAEAHSEADSITPTLRLDTKEIRTAHGHMRAASLPLSPRRIASRALLGTSAACVVGLLVWTMQRPHTPTENAASSTHVTPAALPIASSAPVVMPDISTSPAALAPSNPPPAPVSDTAQAETRVQDQAGVRQTAAASTQTHDEPPALRTAPDHVTTERHHHTQTVARNTKLLPRAVRRPARVQQARVAAVASTGIPRPRRQNSTRSWHASGARHGHSGGNGEEDTFAAHTSPAHSGNGDEWTEKLPQ